MCMARAWPHEDRGHTETRHQLLNSKEEWTEGINPDPFCSELSVIKEPFWSYMTIPIRQAGLLRKKHLSSRTQSENKALFV